MPVLKARVGVKNEELKNKKNCNQITVNVYQIFFSLSLSPNVLRFSKVTFSFTFYLSDDNLSWSKAGNI